MSDGSSCSSFDETAQDALKQRLARIQPELRAHLAHSSRRVQGMEPEDLAQEVVARALRYGDRFDADRALWPWLRQVAQHVLFDHRTVAGRAAESPLEVEHELAAPAVTPLVDSREELDRALASLRPVEREALLRFHQLGESVREIASALDLREGTVKSHLSRARRRLAGLNDMENDRE